LLDFSSEFHYPLENPFYWYYEKFQWIREDSQFQIHSSSFEVGSSEANRWMLIIAKLATNESEIIKPAKELAFNQGGDEVSTSLHQRVSGFSSPRTNDSPIYGVETV
jgi:hypothetical protein